VLAIEVDPKLGQYLRETMGEQGNLDLRIGDALEFPYHELPEGTVVVANLPYYISTPLLFRLFEERNRIDHMVLMLQTEVARRMVAQPGTNDYGILSVLTQYSASASLAFHVPLNCFRPRPEVGSSVVSLAMHKTPKDAGDEARFVRTVRAAFAHRRKTLANSLRDEGFAPDSIARALTQTGILSSRRAETLALEEFAALAAHL
jgi:16S rRNA (adenine1518-N6/adenine1519-N6)-dimethyltransferase